ncbi:MAG: hypothetical protein MI700_14495 [Balneolales bacterium]|nr:hypothetical protein [Balneolales bacterium]
MSFIKISDPKRRDEIIQEYLRTKRSIQQQSFDKILEDKNIYTKQEKLFKPIIDAQKDQSENLQKELQKVSTVLEPLKMLPEAAPLPIEVPKFDGMNLGAMPLKAISDSMSTRDGYDNITGLTVIDGKFYLGDKEVTIDGNDLIIKTVDKDDHPIESKKYKGTPGLWSLIVSKRPIDESYNKEDLAKYSEIMQLTDAIRSEKKPNTHKGSTRAQKWKILGPIWSQQKGKKARSPHPRTSTPKKTGKGVELLPSDPDLLIKMLKLNFASNQAGNTGLRNKIVTILDTLMDMNILNHEDYKNINSGIK